jgi:hypothetical protein
MAQVDASTPLLKGAAEDAGRTETDSFPLATAIFTILIDISDLSATYDHRTLKTSSPVRSAVCQGTVSRFLCRVYRIRGLVYLANTNIASQLGRFANLQLHTIFRTNVRFKYIYASLPFCLSSQYIKSCEMGKRAYKVNLKLLEERAR